MSEEGVFNSPLQVGSDAGHDGQVSPSTSWQDRESIQFVYRYWFLLVLVLAEALLVLGLYLYHRVWARLQKCRARESLITKLCESYSTLLLRHFLPEMPAELQLFLRHRCQFRGMRPKPCGIGLNVAFRELGLQLPDGRRVLEGVTGEFKAGRMCAIMGPSGAGKTTFLNALCGKASYGKTTGSIYVNGQKGSVADCRRVMGFVPQDDTVHEGLTVGEQIRFSVELRNSRGDSAPRRRLIAEDVLSVMQLEHLQNCIVGGIEKRGISGGQRKRVNIGLELASDPLVLFLDEPTSGLDASSSLAVVDSLKRMTQLGTTTVMVVHQPRYSLFKLFDDVLLLGKGGRTVYQGLGSGTQPYFEELGFMMPERENPADWFMDVISGDVPNSKIPDFKPEMLFKLWEQHCQNGGCSPGQEAVAQDTAAYSRQGSGSTNADVRRARCASHLVWSDVVALARRLAAEWPSICADKGAAPREEALMCEEDLVRLLSSAAPCRDRHTDNEEDPDEAAVEFCLSEFVSSDTDEFQREAAQELMRRIAGPGKKEATQSEVVKFLAGLGGVCASDKGLREDRYGKARKDKAKSGFSSLERARAALRSLSVGSLFSTSSPQPAASASTSAGSVESLCVSAADEAEHAAVGGGCRLNVDTLEPSEGSSSTMEYSEGGNYPLVGDAFTLSVLPDAREDHHEAQQAEEPEQAEQMWTADDESPGELDEAVRCKARLSPVFAELATVRSKWRQGPLPDLESWAAGLEGHSPVLLPLETQLEASLPIENMTGDLDNSEKASGVAGKELVEEGMPPTEPPVLLSITSFASEPPVPSFVRRALFSKASIASVASGERVVPGFWKQLAVLMHRSSIQWWRGNFSRGIFLGVTAVASITLGITDVWIHALPEWEVTPILNFHTCFALLTSIFCLNVFGTERTVFWRESSSGLNSLAFFVSKTTIDLVDLVLQCFTFAACYYVIKQPLHPFSLFFESLPLLSWAASGMGYFISTILPPHHGPFVAALAAFVSCGLLGHPLRVEAMEAHGAWMEAFMDAMSLTRWSVSLSFLEYLDKTGPKVWTDEEAQKAIYYTESIYRRKSALPQTMGPFRTEVVFLLLMGLGWRAAAFLGLKLANRSKRR
ncbi:unnamed protein product [Polarella glacialis]|uniref:ABC transporter domain-containing protein n=1 Tax=Polarella glacialis TaxID=89957 RepID=A0A813EDB0_POLGL|nr:unnamed protein product [Polarella glacialis]